MRTLQADRQLPALAGADVGNAGSAGTAAGKPRQSNAGRNAGARIFHALDSEIEPYALKGMAGQAGDDADNGDIPAFVCFCQFVRQGM
ncbi:hypothetical protein GCM10027277_08750 [Pseudoduganella ginsengisoli]